MNDFTLEELEFLYETLAEMVDESTIRDRQQPDIVYEIKAKLAVMINNYCEHAHKQYYADVAIYECNKCHMVML